MLTKIVAIPHCHKSWR